MDLQDVVNLLLRVSFSTTFPKNCGRGESIRSTTFHRNLVGGRKGMLPVRYFRSNKAYYLCQSNFVDIIKLLQR